MPRPNDPGTPLTAPVLCTVRRRLLSVQKKHNAHRDMTTPPATPAYRGGGYAEFRRNGVLGSSAGIHCGFIAPC